jgi:hypothetical protein
MVEVNRIAWEIMNDRSTLAKNISKNIYISKYMRIFRVRVEFLRI